jgi:hypothetical protein
MPASREWTGDKELGLIAKVRGIRSFFVIRNRKYLFDQELFAFFLHEETWGSLFISFSVDPVVHPMKETLDQGRRRPQ